MDGELVNALKYAGKRDADAKIILPEIPDKNWVLLWKSHITEKFEGGVKIYEYTRGLCPYRRYDIEEREKNEIKTI